MVGASARIQVDDAEVKAALAKLADRATHMRDVWDEIGAAMVVSTHERFRRQSGPDGRPWKPSKRVLKEGGQTLSDTRRLDASQTHVADDHGVEWGTNVEYAAAHQFGAAITRHAHSAPIYRDHDAVIADREAFKAGESRFGATPFVKRSKATLETWHEVPEYKIRIPARPFLGIDADDRAEIIAILGDHLDPEAS